MIQRTTSAVSRSLETWKKTESCSRPLRFSSQALVAAPDLEVYEVKPSTSLAAFSDKVNLVPEPED